MGHFMYPDKKIIFRNYFIFHTQAPYPAGSAKAQAPCLASATQASCQAAGSALAHPGHSLGWRPFWGGGVYRLYTLRKSSCVDIHT